MSGISIATIVVEAGETSGALIQAREALKQGRKVFVPRSSVEDPRLRWPKVYVDKKGASPFADIDDLMEQLEEAGLIRSMASRGRMQVITNATRV